MNDQSKFRAGEGSRSSSPVAPDGPGESAASSLPPVRRCDNCRRVVTPTVAAAIFADGRIHVERRLCTACLCRAKDEFVKPAEWVMDRVVPTPMETLAAQHMENARR